MNRLIPRFQNKRSFYAYLLVLCSTLSLIVLYLALHLLYFQGIQARFFLSSGLTYVPLMAVLPWLVKRSLKAYQVVALMAPFHLFIGGLFVLWQSEFDFYWGWCIVLAAFILEVAAIVHNFKKRSRKIKEST